MAFDIVLLRAGIRMLRAILAALAAIVLVVVLSVLIVESRAVKEDYYIEHSERVRAIETSRADLLAIVQASRETFDDGRTFPEAAELALSRLTENNALLQAADERILANPAIVEGLAAYDAELKGFIGDGRSFADTQNSLADSLYLAGRIARSREGTAATQSSPAVSECILAGH